MRTLHVPRSTFPGAVVAGLLLAGCQGYHAGGPGMSIDQYTYESYPEYPQTVTLIDHTTGETLWTMEVPVGKKLVMKIKEGENKRDPARPDILHWDVMDMSVGYETLDNAMPVPPSWSRRVDVTFRNLPSGTPPPRP